MGAAIILILMQSAALPQAAAPPQSKAERAAGTFALDLPPPEPKVVDKAAPAMVVAEPTILCIDTPIRDLLADPHGRAVLDADMDGLSSDANLARFEAMSLRAFQAHTGGQLTDALLAKIATDLADPTAIFTSAKVRKQRTATGR